MKTFKHPAIIIGGGSANGLGIARNLGSLGIKVYCVTSDPNELTLASKYCAGYKLVPGVESDPAILHQFLHAFQKRITRPGVLFPTTDDAVLTLSAIRNEMGDYDTYIPKNEVVETCVDKSKFYKSLEVHGVPHPITLYLDEVEIQEIEERIGFPVFVKPAMSQRFNRVYKSKGFIAHSIQELRQRANLAQQQGIQVLVQEIIPGPASHGYSLRGYIDKASRLAAIMASQKLQQPSLFSNIAIKRSIPLSHLSRANRTLHEYLQCIHYRGLFHSEWKRDLRDDTVKLLEINARSSGGNYFGVACGMNHVLLAYLDCLNESVKPIREYALNLYQINIIRGMSILINKVVHKQLTYQDIRPYFQKKLGHIYSTDDPLPFITMMRMIVDRDDLGNYIQKLLIHTRVP